MVSNREPARGSLTLASPRLIPVRFLRESGDLLSDRKFGGVELRCPAIRWATSIVPPRFMYSVSFGPEAGAANCRLSPTARWCHGSISTCFVSTISQMTSCRIQWESSPQNWQLGLRRLLGVTHSHNPFAHNRLGKSPCRFSYLCWSLTTIEAPH